MVGSPLFKDHHPPHSFGVLSPIDTAFDEFPNPNCQRDIPGDNFSEYAILVISAERVAFLRDREYTERSILSSI